ncbi:hypothetical protein B0H10DRAFT_55299 [Mycena sp. CBHHK59/15]|nr:hypothetical protein B0H10DRAFT_55299 [Mycena sp. CBHHK59/15]
MSFQSSPNMRPDQMRRPDPFNVESDSFYSEEASSETAGSPSRLRRYIQHPFKNFKRQEQCEHGDEARRIPETPTLLHHSDPSAASPISRRRGPSFGRVQELFSTSAIPYGDDPGDISLLPKETPNFVAVNSSLKSSKAGQKISLEDEALAGKGTPMAVPPSSPNAAGNNVSINAASKASTHRLTHTKKFSFQLGGLQHLHIPRNEGETQDNIQCARGDGAPIDTRNFVGAAKTAVTGNGSIQALINAIHRKSEGEEQQDDRQTERQNIPSALGIESRQV